ncbi:hypothetical protein KVC97_00135 [Helicobacter pylori]|nr:hypothetical protein KVC97_00135 [Helicobacter pylori]
MQDFIVPYSLGYGANKKACHEAKSGKHKVGSVKIANALLNDYTLKFLFLGLR